MIALYLFLALLLVVTHAEKAEIEWTQMEADRSHPLEHNFIHEAELQYREGLTWEGRAHSDLEHKLVFQVKNRMEEFQKLLQQIGDPESERYGETVTDDVIFQLMKNPEGERIIVNYLESAGVRITTQAPGYITAAAPVRVWNDLLKADFHMVHTGQSHLAVPRTRVYHLPTYVANHVDMVLNTVQIPILQDASDPPAFTAVFSNSTSLDTDEFSATVIQKNLVIEDNDEEFSEL